jgi:hypothetical protein
MPQNHASFATREGKDTATVPLYCIVYRKPIPEERARRGARACDKECQKVFRPAFFLDRKLSEGAGLPPSQKSTSVQRSSVPEAICAESLHGNRAHRASSHLSSKGSPTSARSRWCPPVGALWLFRSITPRLGAFYRWNLTRVLVQFDMRILLSRMVGGSTTFCAEPLLSSGIPADVQVFHD